MTDILSKVPWTSACLEAESEVSEMVSKVLGPSVEGVRKGDRETIIIAMTPCG